MLPLNVEKKGGTLRYIGIAMGCIVLLFLFLLKKEGLLGKLFERIALFWFKVAIAVVVLFVGNLFLSNYGLFVPINLFSIITLSILGLPGAICISLLLLMK